MISAKLSQLGVKYLSRTNLPVEVVEITESNVKLKCLFAVSLGKIIDVPLDYPLNTYDETSDVDAQENSDLQEKNNMDTVQTKKRGGLSALMDPLFFEGGHTVQEITDIVAQKDPSATEGRNLLANVRVRIAVLKKRGYQIETSENKSIKLVK